MARWWSEKWAVRVGDGDGFLVGYRYAWWQFRKRRRFGPDAVVRDLEQRFDWRSIRIGFRRPEDHWRNDVPPIRPRRGRYSI